MDDVRLDNERLAATNAQAQTQAQADDATRQKNQAQLRSGSGRASRNQAQSDHRECAGRTLPDAQAAQAQAETDTADANAAADRARSDSDAGEIRHGKQSGQLSHGTERSSGGCRSIPTGSTAGAGKRATGRQRQSRYARQIVRAVEFDSSDSRYRARPHRQHVRCFVRHREDIP